MVVLHRVTEIHLVLVMVVTHSGVVQVLLLTDNSSGHKDIVDTLHMVLVVLPLETESVVAMDAKVLL
tara:strand:+ start:279 stop:479 length:201 start_codon:yes stop_codon:yes gene_type:complete